MTEQFANFASSTLAEDISAGATSIEVVSATSFPDEPLFRIAIDREIFLVTDVDGTTFTVTSGYEDTAQADHSSGASVKLIISAGILNGMAEDIADLQALIPGKLQVVATRGAMPNALRNGAAGGRSDTRFDGRRKYFVGRQAVKDIRLAFAGFYCLGGSGEQLIGNDYGIEAAIELESPVTYGQAYFGYNRIGNVPDGIPFVLSDPPVGFDFDAGGSFFVRISHTLADSSKNFGFATAPVGVSGDSGFISPAATSQVQATGAMTTPSGGTSFNGAPPYMVLGIPASPMVAVGLLSDSIGNGSNDTPDNFGDIGFMTRGLNSVDGYPVPWVMQTVGSDTMLLNQIDRGARKRAAWRYFTHLLCELSTNDIANGATLSQMQARATSIWKAAKRTIGPYDKPLKVGQTSTMPRLTTTIDNWSSPEGQTVFATGFAPGGVRDQFNAWCLSQVGQGLLDYFIDVNPYVEDPNNHGKWITNGTPNYPCNDGIHPNSPLHILAAQAVHDWALTIEP